MNELLKTITGIAILSLLGYVGGFLLIGGLAVVYAYWEIFAVVLGIILVICIVSFVKTFLTLDNKRDFLGGIITILWLIATPFVWYHYQYWYTPFVWLLLLIILSIPLNWKELKTSVKEDMKKAEREIEEEKKQRELANK